MNKTFYGLGFILLAITSPLWASSTDQRMPYEGPKGYFWYQDTPQSPPKDPHQKSFGPSTVEPMAMDPDTLKKFSEAPNLSIDSTVTQDLREARDDFALALFTVNNCLACKSQKQMLMQFKERHGWKIKEYSVQEHPKLVNAFNIYSAPTVLLIRKLPAQWIRLSVGRQSIADIEKNVAEAVRLMCGGDKS